jgi:hypothetical protein
MARASIAKSATETGNVFAAAGKRGWRHEDDLSTVSTIKAHAIAISSYDYLIGLFLLVNAALRPHLRTGTLAVELLKWLDDLPATPLAARLGPKAYRCLSALVDLRCRHNCLRRIDRPTLGKVLDEVDHPHTIRNTIVARPGVSHFVSIDLHHHRRIQSPWSSEHTLQSQRYVPFREPPARSQAHVSRTN